MTVIFGFGQVQVSDQFKSDLNDTVQSYPSDKQALDLDKLHEGLKVSDSFRKKTIELSALTIFRSLPV